MTMAILPIYVGFWLLFRSIMSIGFAFSSNAAGASNWGWLLVAGILMLLFSILLLANPVFTSFSIVYMTAFAFIFMGVFRLFLAFDLKKMKKMKKNNYSFGR
jgi:uncharacterized membrane protein HdeD (DUF308 family)